MINEVGIVIAGIAGDLFSYPGWESEGFIF
jgi:hypothetical protein